MASAILESKIGEGVEVFLHHTGTTLDSIFLSPGQVNPIYGVRIASTSREFITSVEIPPEAATSVYLSIFHVLDTLFRRSIRESRVSTDHAAKWKCLHDVFQRPIAEAYSYFLVCCYGDDYVAPDEIQDEAADDGTDDPEIQGFLKYAAAYFETARGIEKDCEE